MYKYLSVSLHLWLQQFLLIPQPNQYLRTGSMMIEHVCLNMHGKKSKPCTTCMFIQNLSCMATWMFSHECWLGWCFKFVDNMLIREYFFPFHFKPVAGTIISEKAFLHISSYHPLASKQWHKPFMPSRYIYMFGSCSTVHSFSFFCFFSSCHPLMQTTYVYMKIQRYSVWEDIHSCTWTHRTLNLPLTWHPSSFSSWKLPSLFVLPSLRLSMVVCSSWCQGKICIILNWFHSKV